MTTAQRRAVGRGTVGAEVLERIGRGETVVVIAPGRAAARAWFEWFDSSIGDMPVTVRRANGEEEIRHASGGWIRFHVRPGMTLDAIYVDGEVGSAALDLIVLLGREGELLEVSAG